MRIAFTSRSDYYVLGGNYFAPNTILLLVILNLRRQKVFWYGERLLPSSSKWIYYVKRALIMPVNLFTKAIFAVGNSAILSYRNHGYRKPIFNTPYAINNHIFNGIEFRKYSANSKIIFLSSGSLIHRKGYDLAIKAFNLLDDHLKCKLEYWILGDGPLKKDLERMVEPGLDVKFKGFVEPSNIAHFFKDASVFLLTSRYDGWGVVVNEAIAAGLPLIVTNNCGAAEYVNEHNGFVVTNNINEISVKIAHLIEHIEDRVKFAAYNNQISKSISSDSIATRLFEHICKF